MDPDATLAEMRKLLAACDDGDPIAAQDLAEGVRALDEWLSKGGFLPEAWAR